MKVRFLFTLLASFLMLSSASAQYFPFGKNRVQYDDFEWRYIQSKHFDIYYYNEKNYELAEFTALSVESAYKQVQKDFNHEISDRISVIIYDSHNDFSQTNVVNLPNSAEGIGGVTDKYKNRITLPFDGDYNDFRRTIHHELVHAIFNDMFYGGSVQSIIQNNINLVFPLWFEEGLAEYSALGWDSNTDMYIRDAVINNYLPPIQYLSGYYSYRGGQSLWNYIAEEYGREKIAEILQRIRNSRSVEYGMTAALGMNIEELSEKWTEALKKRYYPEVAERERSESVGSLLTERGKFGTYNTSPAISPQGDKIAFITNSRGYFDVVVISAINGQKLKTVIRGEDNPNFEELNILNPNLTWSPDGTKLAMSTKTKGRDDLAIIDYATSKVSKLKFPSIDAIGSVAWAPDNSKIAFDANIGPYQDIFVYDFNEKSLTNVTKDFFSDREPAWSADSKSVYFISDRGDKTELSTYALQHNLFSGDGFYQTDIYKVDLGATVAERITETPIWSEMQPVTSYRGDLYYISDENGIQNVYKMDLASRTSSPITDLQSGISQISVSADGSRIAFNAINEGYLDIFLLKSPEAKIKSEPLTKNYWAQRRATESKEERVPAIAYAREMFDTGVMAVDKAEEKVTIEEPEVEQTNDNIDFRNYVFADDVVQDTTLYLKDVESFSVEDNITDDGRYIPQEYRLKFGVDIAYSPTFVASTYGSFALTQFIISDLLGDHQISIGTNFVFDLKDSDYSFQYGNFKNRTNYFFSYFHTSRKYQSYFGELIRYRTYGVSSSIQYPFDKFRRLDFNLSFLNIDLNYNSVFNVIDDTGNSFQTSDPSETSRFLYPEVVFTSDKTLPGFLTPRAGSRFSVGLSGSPSFYSGAPEFVSVLGDFRKYFDLGLNTSIALRFSGGASIGKDAQNYFLGGKLGWINQKWSDTGLPVDRITDNFFSVPALPLRGYEYNAINGENFSLINAEFRFPLFAAIIPGAIPILPLYNITGVAFLDVGTAWGSTNNLGIYVNPSTNSEFVINSKSLDFKPATQEVGYIPIGNNTFQEVNYLDGDLLIGAGFGFRSIVFGLPFGYDVGWAHDGSSFYSDPVHYFSIGIDF